MDIRNLTAPQGYTAARPATQPDAQSETIEDGLKGVVSDFAATLQQGENAALGSMTGDVDPHALVQALAQTELAVETAITVRNKVVEAYQEILRMPV
jgi:flagellar hook-basal body complex protein FliE